MKKLLLSLLAVLSLVLAGCSVDIVDNNDNGVQIANPASEYCINEGGSLEIRTSSEGQYGVCIFKDNTECEEWAFFRGECSDGEFHFNPETQPSAGHIIELTNDKVSLVFGDIAEDFTFNGDLSKFKVGDNVLVLYKDGEYNKKELIDIRIDADHKDVFDFDSCVAAGNPVLESYPRQCPHGEMMFVEDISKDAMCGGIAAIQCDEGYTCELDGNYPDASGICVKSEYEERDFTNRYLESLCEDNNGNWISETKECEYISEEKCAELNGEFLPCESACRNDPDSVMCTMQCVLVCKLDSETRKENCETQGGKFDKLGMAQIEQCNTKTSDFNNTCSDSSECSGVCLKGGKCSEWTINFGCIEIVEDGKDVTICID